MKTKTKTKQNQKCCFRQKTSRPDHVSKCDKISCVPWLHYVLQSMMQKYNVLAMTNM